ncbi:MAG: Uma2 family endonuclease [Planctomycetota bacterium]
MSRLRVRFNREDLEQLSEHQRAELHEGDLVMIPSPDPWHGKLTLDLASRLRELLGAGEAYRVLVAPVDVVVDDENVVQPDVLVLPEGTVVTKPRWEIPSPIWVAEVLSPKTAKRDRGIKLRIYRRAGVREAWLVDPAPQTIEVHDLSARQSRTYAAGASAASAALQGFEVAVDDFFALP